MKLLSLFTTTILFVTVAVHAQRAATLFRTNYPGFSTEYNLPILMGGRFYLGGSTTAAGTELMSAPLDLASSTLVKDIYRGTSDCNINGIGVAGSKLVFTANDGLHGQELWASDGTGANTVQLTDINSGATSTFGSLFDFREGDSANTYVILQDSYSGMYATDGTVAGTHKVRNDGAFYLGAGKTIIVTNQNNGADSILSYDYATNTSTFLTQMPTNLYYYYYPGNRPINQITMGNKLVFGMYSAIIVTDGTPGGTNTYSLINGNQFTYATGFTALHGKVYFSAYQNATGNELFSLDPTTGEVVLEADINQQNNGQAGSIPQNLVAVGDTLFFTADDGFIGPEIYKYGSTTPSTPTLLTGQELVAGQVSLGNIALDAVGTSLLVSNTYNSSYRPFWYTNGQVRGLAHTFKHLNATDNVNNETALGTIRNDGRHFAVFGYSDPDTLAIVTDGAFKLVQRNNTPSYFPYFPVAVNVGQFIYVSSNYTAFIWRINTVDVSIKHLVTAATAYLPVPNPTRASFLLKGQSVAGRLELINATGQVVLNAHVDAQEQVPTLGQQPGLYIWRFSGVDGHHQTGRVVIE